MTLTVVSRPSFISSMAPRPKHIFVKKRPATGFMELVVMVFFTKVVQNELVDMSMGVWFFYICNSK